MVFEFLKKTFQDINEEWETKEMPLRLHKSAFEFLQKEFGAFYGLYLTSTTIKEREAIAKNIYADGGNVYDICWEYYFKSELISGYEYESVRRVYNACKFYIDEKKFALKKSYEGFESLKQRVEDKFF